MPIWISHRDGTLGIVDGREGGNKGMWQQDLDSGGDNTMGQETRETGELQVKIL